MMTLRAQSGKYELQYFGIYFVFLIAMINLLEYSRFTSRKVAGRVDLSRRTPALSTIRVLICWATTSTEMVIIHMIVTSPYRHSL